MAVIVLHSFSMYLFRYNVTMTDAVGAGQMVITT